jgi:hypothetical protein
MFDKRLAKFLALGTALFLAFAPQVAHCSDTPQKNEIQQLPEEEKNNTEEMAAAIYFNSWSGGDHTIYKAGKDYWIPYAWFLEQSHLREEKLSGTTNSRFVTSIGTVTFNNSELKIIAGSFFISLSSLKKSFFIKGAFDTSQFAIQLDIPWAPVEKSGKPNVIASKPDIKAPGSSLSFISLDSNMEHDFDGTTNSHIKLDTGGRVAGGVWDMTCEGDPQKRMELTRYHWTTFSDHIAFRLGTGISGIYTLLGEQYFTGGQFAWNNRNIYNHLDVSAGGDTDIFITFDRQMQRSVDGNGPPAGIAELRFDGRVAARQRIGFDGRFIFENVRMSTDLRKTEVYIYERSLQEKPLAILNFTQSVFNRSLPGGELMVRGGFGRTGNPLIDNTTGSSSSLYNGNTGFGHIQYGLSKRITLEAGAVYDPLTGSENLLAGSVVSLASNWIAALYGSRANNRYGTDMRLEGRGKGWNISYWTTRKDAGFMNNSTAEQQDNWLRSSINPFNQLTMLLYGRLTRENSIETRRYLLPGFYFSPFQPLRLSAIPDDDKDYRYEADIRFSAKSDIRLSYEKKRALLDYYQDIGDSYKARLFGEYAVETGSKVTGMYFDIYPRSSRYDLFELGISQSDGKIGFSGMWNKYINAGMHFSVQYSYNMNNARNLVLTNEYYQTPLVPNPARHFISCTLNWDLGFSGKRFYPVNRSTISTTRGGLAGSLAIEGETSLKPSDINDVGILINGLKFDQRQIDGSFFVGNLKPGIYDFSVDPENLPMELSLDKKEIKVQVKNGSITNVSIPVHAEYGIAGRLLDPSGNGVADGKLVLTDPKNNTVATFSTNEFGYYRADGLRSGKYLLKPVSVTGRPTENAEARTVNIKNDYLFDIDVTVAVPSPPQKAAEPQGEKSGR